MYCLCIFSLRGWDEQVSERAAQRGTKKQRDERERERERERQPPSPKDISSVNSTGRFSIPSAFSFLRAEQIAKGTT